MNKKRVFAALMLIAIALTTLAYAQLFTGEVTIDTEQVLFIDTGTVSTTAPAGGSQKFNFTEFMELNLTQGGLSAGDKLLVRVEIVPLDDKIFEFRSLVVRIVQNLTTVKAVLTKHMLADEFEVTVPSPVTGVAKYMYDAEMICVSSDKKPLTAKFRFSATILSVTWA